MTFLQHALAGAILAVILLDVMLAVDILARDPELELPRWLRTTLGGQR